MEHKPDDEEKVCPIITAGWFGSERSAGRGMWETRYLKCYKEKCGCWDKTKKRCGLIR